MTEQACVDRRIGKWAAISVAAIALVYVIVGIIGVVAQARHTDPLRQVDPFLFILELLIFLCAPTLVVMMTAVHANAPPERKTYSLVALGFMLMFSVLTCGVHFARLTVGRQVAASQEFSRLLSLDWPSITLAIDLLAWDFFLGLSLLFAAFVFSGSRLQTNLRAGMVLGGSLCVAGSLGPLLGYMELALLGVLGYALVLPMTCVFLAILFAQPRELTTP